MDHQQILNEGKKYFSENTITAGLKLLQLNRTSISFNKGSAENYFIVSGLVNDDFPYEVKVVYKKRLIEEGKTPLTTTCNCFEWSDEHHCKHAASLYFSYLVWLHHQENGPESFVKLDDSPLPPVNSFAAHPDQYGTIINSPNQLVADSGRAIYSTMQYLLTNKKLVNFPIPDEFSGQLKINITTPDNIQSFDVAFSHLIDGVEFSKISIFENLYLFNWDNGRAWHLPQEIKDLGQKFRINRFTVTIDDLILSASEYSVRKYVISTINNTELDELKALPTIPKVYISPSSQSGLLRMTLTFHDEHDHLAPIPAILKNLTFENGDLNHFKKKKDAYEFINAIKLYLEDSTNETYKRSISGFPNRVKIIEEMALLHSTDHFTQFDLRSKKLFQYDYFFMKKLIIELIQSFSELLFRFSSHHKDDHRVTYDLTNTSLFSGISSFYQKMSPLGVTIFYNDREIAKWSSRVRFERKSSLNSWFDLDLIISENDLDIIRKADLESGVSISENGITLFTNDQKDLLRLVKRYTTDGKSSEKKLEEEDLKSFSLPFNRARIFELFELRKMGIDGALTDEEIQLCQNLESFDKIPEYPVPDRTRDIIRPYQMTGYNWLRFLYENKLGACLADDMGLGKTLQTVTFIESIIDKVEKILIICPISILLNWEKEFSMYSNIDVQIYHGGERSIDPSKKVILTSYGIMKKEVNDTFSDVNFDILVMDEVQHLKNIRSLGAFSARKINANFKICLTGTPVENDLSEFYNILDLCVPGIWGDLQYVRTTSTKKSRLIARKTAAPFILRRTKEEVLTELPPKIENNIFLSFNEDELDRYNNQLKLIRTRIATKAQNQRYGEILKGLLRLRQHCLWPVVDDATGISFSRKIIRETESAKIVFLLETLEQILQEGHQAIVFSQFTSYLDIIQLYIEEKHWAFSRIDGAQDFKKRQKEIDAFQKKEKPIFLISLKAGGTGLNLTAASYVFIMDPWWNPAVENQAIDRAHRIGQLNNLTVYRPIIKDSIEEKVLKLQETKKELFTDLLSTDDGESFSGRLSMKDFEALLSDD